MISSPLMATEYDRLIQSYEDSTEDIGTETLNGRLTFP
jgi:hypothetical protein